MALKSYLSEYVYNIIVNCGNDFVENERCNKFITPNLTYNWLEIERFLENPLDDLDILLQSESLVLNNVKLVWEAVHMAGSLMNVATDEQRDILFKQCEWVLCPDDLAKYQSSSDLKDDSGILLAILHMTAAFERAMGNVFLTKHKPVPFLLRDLLRTSEIHNTFGKVPILFTQLILGTPRGLNIRNVVWHGFLVPGELHPHLVSGLMVLFASLSQILNLQIIPKRRLFTAFDTFHNDLNGVFCNFVCKSEEVLAMLKSSPIIGSHNIAYWEKAYDLFLESRFGDSLVLQMPLLEHCLRLIYCKVNDCSVRLLTAEATTLYTTLDEILAPSDISVVGEGLLMTLLDLTTSLSGPRLRDKLSHGEYDLSLVPQWLANHVFGIALAVSHHKCGEGGGEECGVPLCGQLKHATSCYHSKFHPLATLRCIMDSLLAQWESWQHLPQPSDLTVVPARCPHISALDAVLFPSCLCVRERVEVVNKTLQCSNPLTLYRPRTELELATSLLHVVKCLAETVEKMRHVIMLRHQQWCDRSLRSRARLTCLRMWNTQPDMWCSLLCVLRVTALCYQCVIQLAQHHSHITKPIKVMRKAVENIVIMSEKSRWLEAHQVLSTMAQFMCQWINKNINLLTPHQ